ncbi:MULTISPECIES: hypothetical protein [Rhizobium]|uniref:hypothetical protein n=1 Tax=Rhizobium TaxID=379 RepID=UPI0003FAC358|nr:MULTISPECIES: hypothetical protein [Rhizobium]MCS0462532.1 hypothetical protein [Rhizobium favelukesii]UFS79419.1 hypothetical protein LPB79_07500 [Rhizobium sp. T136]
MSSERAETRDIEPKRDSFDNPKGKERSEKEWDTMKLEVGGTLPDIGEAFAIVRDFCHSLPWT